MFFGKKRVKAPKESNGVWVQAPTKFNINTPGLTPLFLEIEIPHLIDASVAAPELHFLTI